MSYEYLKSVKKIVCIGRNYVAHIKELNNVVPKQPLYFLKPTTCLITPQHNSDISALNKLSDDTTTKFNSIPTFRGINKLDGTNPSPIYIPKNVQVSHEIELALIIKDTISNVSHSNFTLEDCLSNIQGFALALDLTARNVQEDAKRQSFPWTFSKGYDTFCPISHIVPLSQLRLPANLHDIQSLFRLRCFVNGELRQDGTCDMMLNPLEKVVSYITEVMTLEAGDLVLTGTPAGVGPLRVGDVVRGELWYGDERVVEMEFYCEERPGDYVYRGLEESRD